MILYRIEDLPVYEKLCNDKILHCDPMLGEHYLEFDDGGCGFKNAYDWMYEQYSRRTHQDLQPVWWGYLERPDLRYERWLYSQNSPQVLLTLDIPNELVLVFDDQFWHSCLSGSYQSSNQEDDEWFYKTYFGHDENGWDKNFDHESVREIRNKLILESWNKMFDSSQYYVGDDWFGPHPHYQAVFAPLRLEWVINIKKFNGCKKEGK